MLGLERMGIDMKKDNKIIVDLNKVQHARLYYENQFGDKVEKALEHSSRGVQYNPMALAFNLTSDMILETLEHRAVRLKIKDIWTPVCRLKLTANECLEYTGDKAISIYKEWCKRIFKKGK